MVRGDSIFVFVVEYIETILLIEHSMCYWHANGSWLLLLLSLLPICLFYYGRAKQSKKTQIQDDSLINVNQTPKFE